MSKPNRQAVQQQRYHRLKAEGLCTRCGIRRAEAGTASCRPCRAERGAAAQSRDPEPKGRRERSCLKCETRFMSEGPHHRKCQRCRAAMEAGDPGPNLYHLPRLR